MKIKLICCIGLDYDLDLIPHFCEHYSKFNINNYHFILHSKNDFKIDYFLEYFTNLSNDNVIFDKWVGEFNSIDKIYKFNNIIKQMKESHILLADVDEFQIHKNNEITDDYVWGRVINKKPKGSLTKKVTKEDISKQFPIDGKPSWENNIKPCVFPKKERLNSSHHLKTNYNYEPTIRVNHYRWTDSRLEKSNERFKVYTKLNKMGKRFETGHKLLTQESLDIINKLKPKSIL